MASETFGSTTIISDVGPTANSYISVADAKAYYDLDPNKDYSAIADETLAQALITARFLLDAYYGDKYRGTLYDQTYATFWPRVGVYDERGILIEDYTEFPTQLGYAQAEQAYYGATEDREAETTISNVLRKQLEGVGSITYMSASDQRLAASKGLFVDRAAQLIKPFVTGSTSPYIDLMSRG